MTRQHVRTLVAIERRPPAAAASAHVQLVAPCPGWFRSAVRVGDVVGPGQHLGLLEVLGQLIEITVPASASGLVVAVVAPGLARAPVDHGAQLVALDPTAASFGAASAHNTAASPAATTSSEAAGLVFRAPTSGRFYRRSAPEKAAFVDVGTELAHGATVCLLEVMKTFHRVTYGGPALPARAKVTQLLVADGDDVTAGDALLALEAT